MFKAVLLIFAAVIFAGHACATTYLLQADGTGDFPTIQEAIDASVTGDTILLADGTYHEDAPYGIFFWGKDLTLKSQNGDPNTCIYDAMGVGGGFDISHGESRAAVIEGITVCGGASSGLIGGIGVRHGAAATIRNCIIRNNIAHSGGGIYVGNLSEPLIENCHIHHNRALSYGCAGGIYYSSDGIEIIGCLIENNEVGFPGSGSGGAILGEGKILIRDSVIRHNHAGNEGGAFSLGGAVDLINCQIYGNVSDRSASAMVFYNAPWTWVNISNCTIVGNSSPEGPAIENKIAFTGYPTARVTMENTIVAFNPGGRAFDNEHPDWDIDFRCTDIFGHEEGDWNFPLPHLATNRGNICADPLFCDLETFDLTLRSDSPCLPHNVVCDTLMGALGQGCVITAIEEAPTAAARLDQNTPNPFNATTRISFRLDRDLPVTLRIVDLRGRIRATVIERETLSAGEHALMWDGTDADGRTLPSGVYLVCLRTGDRLLSRKMTLLK